MNPDCSSDSLLRNYWRVLLVGALVSYAGFFAWMALLFPQPLKSRLEYGLLVGTFLWVMSVALVVALQALIVWILHRQRVWNLTLWREAWFSVVPVAILLAALCVKAALAAAPARVFERAVIQPIPPSARILHARGYDGLCFSVCVVVFEVDEKDFLAIRDRVAPSISPEPADTKRWSKCIQGNTGLILDLGGDWLEWTRHEKSESVTILRNQRTGMTIVNRTRG